ncbi:MAG: FkbM family methyltransferase [Alphaproteobacteria bacterium]
MRPPRWIVRLPVVGQVTAKIFRWIALQTQLRYSIVRREGILIVADLKSIIGKHMYSRGFWEADQIEFLFGFPLPAPASPTGKRWFVDIGANTGLYSVYSSKHGRFDRRLAFEPERRNLIELKFNLQINEIETVEIQEVGLSDKEGAAILHNVDNRGRCSLEETSEAGHSQDIRITTFDQLFQPTGTILVVKMDIEGHEIPALKGMKDALTRNSALLQVESSAEKRPALEAFFSSVGYRRFHSIGDDHYFRNF